MQGIFLDIETTGLNPTTHYPIDIAFKVIDLSTGNLQRAYQTVIKISKDEWDKRDFASIEVNGFSWEEILQGKDFDRVSEDIIAILCDLQIQRGSAVFICQNPAFDRGFFNQLVDVYRQEELNWPYHWLDLASMFWAILIYQRQQEGKIMPEKISLSKNEIANVYRLSPEASPHRAMKGVDHLIACYKSVLALKWKDG